MIENEYIEFEVSFQSEGDISKSEPGCQLNLVILGQMNKIMCDKESKLRAKLVSSNVSVQKSMIPEREHVKKLIMPSEGLQKLMVCHAFFHSCFYMGKGSGGKKIFTPRSGAPVHKLIFLSPL